MNYFKQKAFYRVDKKYFQYFLNEYWFIPSDILQRGIEANIWSLCKFNNPVLSIGIGNGKIDKILFKKHGLMDTGIDLDDSQMDIAKKLKIYKKVLCVNAEKMPFKSGSFSTVISNSTFEHIKNDKKAIAEVSRVIKPGGMFFLTVPSNFLEKWILNSNKKRSKQKLRKFNKRAQHYNYHTKKEWEGLMELNNFEIIFHSYFFPKKVTLLWYKLFRIFTFKIKKRELWSYVGHSKFTKLFPKKIIIKLIEKILLGRIYKNDFLIKNNEGAQHFFIAKKIG